jgi:protein required for attachment to host cells
MLGIEKGARMGIKNVGIKETFNVKARNLMDVPGQHPGIEHRVAQSMDVASAKRRADLIDERISKEQSKNDE